MDYCEQLPQQLQAYTVSNPDDAKSCGPLNRIEYVDMKLGERNKGGVKSYLLHDMPARSHKTAMTQLKKNNDQCTGCTQVARGISRGNFSIQRGRTGLKR